MLDPWLSRELVCPRDKFGLRADRDELVRANDHRYPVVDGIPILLLAEVKPTHAAAARSLEDAARRQHSRRSAEIVGMARSVDSFVQREVVATNGLMYRPLVGRLTDYPIPVLRIPSAGSGERCFLDLGCSWGRWCIAACRLGYRPVGIDPSLDAIRAAYRVARQVGADARYVVGDARHLPFRDNRFTVAFSYSVLQHFEKADAALALGEARRVLQDEGVAVIQMPNAFGIRCLYQQAHRGFRHPRDFEVRYWRPGELKTEFSRLIGPTPLSVDGCFSLNPQPAEASLLPWRFRRVVRASELLRATGEKVSPLLYVADSLYVTARKRSEIALNDPGSSHGA